MVNLAKRNLLYRICLRIPPHLEYKLSLFVSSDFFSDIIEVTLERLNRDGIGTIYSDV